MQRLEVLQKRLEHWCAASIRALAHQPSADYRGHVLQIDGRPLDFRAPYLRLDFATHDTKKLRGVADGIALRLRYSDHALHQKLSPQDNLEFYVFDLLEQLRCESLAPDHLPGIRKNLRVRFLFWADQANNSSLVETHAGILIFALVMICWSRLMNEPISEMISEIIEVPRGALSREIGTPLYQLRKCRTDQTEFSQHALEIATAVKQMLSESAVSSEEADDAKSAASSLNDRDLKLLGINQDRSPTEQSGFEQQHDISNSTEIAQLQGESDYRVFTTEFDHQRPVTKLVRAAQLSKLREKLDKRLREQSINSHRLARYLQQLFATPQLSGWSFGEEDGVLDASRLARLLTSPDDRRLFRKEAAKPSMDCVVSILLDNSGSMTHHNESIAILVDTLSRSLELAGIKNEILGFTTGAWNGGRVYKKWLAAGKPQNPGRLNEISHTIYKAAQTPWRRARQGIAGLLKTDLFREGIDGEALQWAASRLTARHETRKVILMISDGSPMDSATNLVNDERYLDRHLLQVAKDLENQSDIALCALGVGLDLSAYFSRSVSIGLQQEFSNQVLFEIADLIGSAK